MPTTANMSLLLPIVSTTIGPLWASEINNALILVDEHDHSPGKGVPVTSAGISLNGDLPFNSYNATTIRSTRYINNLTPLALPSDLSAIYVSGGNLYYNNEIGQQVQITAGAGLNAASIGAIGGDYGTSTASVFYTSATQTFTFWQDANTPAILDTGPIILRPTTVSPFGITLQAPTAIAADYTVTLPLSAPASTKILTMDSTGTVAAAYDVDNTTIQVVANTISVITSNLIPPGTITAYAGFGTAPTGYLYCDGAAVSRTTYAALFAAIGVQWGNGNQTSTFNLPQMQGLFARGVNNGTGNDADAATRTAVSGGTLILTGDWSNGFPTVSNLSDTSNIAIGAATGSSYFPAGTVVSAILGPTSVQMSQNANSTQVGQPIDFTNSATGDYVGSFQETQNLNHTHGVTDPGHSHTITVTTSSPAAGNFVNSSTSAVSAGTAGTNTNTTGLTVNTAGGNQSNPRNVYVNYLIKT